MQKFSSFRDWINISISNERVTIDHHIESKILGKFSEFVDIRSTIYLQMIYIMKIVSKKIKKFFLIFQMFYKYSLQQVHI